MVVRFFIAERNKGDTVDLQKDIITNGAFFTWQAKQSSKKEIG